MSIVNTLHSAGRSKFNPNYEFGYTINGQRCNMMVTSVTGHLMELDFPPQYKKWTSVSPAALFNRTNIPAVRQIPKDKTNIADNLKQLARRCAWLVLWLDCDREGENIAFEVIEVCKKANRNLRIFRAHFSSLTHAELHKAINSLRAPNAALSAAVDARSELDLRIGAALTRFQTMQFQDKFAELDSVISFGGCQFPTLGFVVDRYWRNKYFVSEPFWSIKVTIEKEGVAAEFKWERTRLFDKATCENIYSLVMKNPQARVLVASNPRPKKKWKPLPLTTVYLQKQASKYMRISAHNLMQIADSLYQQGYISYPRTETDRFPNGYGTDKLKSLIQNQVQDPTWGNYAASLMNGQKWMSPRAGKNDDKSHPPIHPTKHGSNFESQKHKQVYEYITRHFLACCSKDAIGEQRSITVEIGGEKFFANGLLIKERNYLDVFPYDKWSSGAIPALNRNEVITPKSIVLHDSSTQPPPLLTESDLIGLMDKNAIGTDATIAQHINKILGRGYIVRNGRHLAPTTLGEALIAGYNFIGMRKLSQAHMRAKMEADMDDIARGLKTKDEVILSNLAHYNHLFSIIQQNAEKLIHALSAFYDKQSVGSGASVLQQSFSKCGKCANSMQLVENQKGRTSVYCTGCNERFSLPRSSAYNPDTSFRCPICNYETINVQSKKKSSYRVCPYCYNNPPKQPDIEDAGSATMPCFACTHDTCEFAGGQAKLVARKCPACKGPMHLRKTKTNKFFVGCGNYPNCKKSVWFPDGVLKAKLSSVACDTCRSTTGAEIKKIHFAFDPNAVQPGDIQFVGCIGGCDPRVNQYFQTDLASFNNPSSANFGTNGSANYGGRRTLPAPQANPPRFTPNQSSRSNNSYGSSNTNFNNRSYANATPSYPSSSANFNTSRSGGFNNGFAPSRGTTPSYGSHSNNSFGSNNSRPSQNNGGGGTPVCNCGQPCDTKTVNKPGKTQGKRFYTCSVGTYPNKGCDYFDWVDKDDNSFSGGSHTGNTSKKRKTTYKSNGPAKKPRNVKSEKRRVRKCSNCGQPGHDKRKCWNK